MSEVKPRPFGWFCELVHRDSGEVIKDTFSRVTPLSGDAGLTGFIWRATAVLAAPETAPSLPLQEPVGEEEAREMFNAWYDEQAMPQLLARVDPQQAAHNAFEFGRSLAAPSLPAVLTDATEAQEPEVWVVVVEDDSGGHSTPDYPGGPIVFETRVDGATRERAVAYAASLGSKYGKTRVARLVFEAAR